MLDSNIIALNKLVSDLASRCLSEPWEYTQQRLGALMQALQNDLSAMAASESLRPEQLQFASTVLFPEIQDALATMNPVGLSHALHDLLGPWLTALQSNTIESADQPKDLA
jgi:hypothetical protein